jgi:hypothetical protein
MSRLQKKSISAIETAKEIDKLKVNLTLKQRIQFRTVEIRISDEIGVFLDTLSIT